MKRKFVTNLALLLLLNLLIKPFWLFGIDRGVQNAVGASDYGLYLALFNFSLIFNILLDVGITNFNNKNIAQHNHLLSKHFSKIAAIKFLLAIGYTVISVIIAFSIGWKKIEIYLLLFLVLNQFLSSFILYLRSNLSGLLLFRTDSLISVLDRTLMIIIVGFLLYNPNTHENFKIEWFIYSQTIAYTITLIITFIVLSGKLEFIKLQWDRKFFIAFLKQSYPYALLVLLMSLYNRLEPIMLERILPGAEGASSITTSGAFQAGIYAQAFRILDASAMFGLLFAGLLLPMFANMIKNKEPIGELAKLSFSLIIVPAILLAISSYIYCHEIMDLLYPDHTVESSKVLSILMLGFVFISTTYIFGTLLTANGSMKQLNTMAIIAVILNLTLNIILIPNFLVVGAAYSSLITQAVTAIVQVFIALSIFKLKIDYKYLLKLVVFIASLIVFGKYINENIDNWIYGIISFFATGGIVAFGIGLISLKTLYRIIKYEK